MNLPTIFTKKPAFKYQKTDSSEFCPNILKRNFKTSAPNQAWVGDITYVKVGGKYCYVCMLLDLYSRKVVAYSVSTNMKANLVIRTLEIAMKNRNFPGGVVVHSDRGSQYTSSDYRKKIDEFHLVQSFSRPGCPYDNAAAESFFRYFKQGETNRRSYRTLEDLRLATFNYIENYYNNYNPHSFNNGLTPNEAEQNFYSSHPKT